MIYDTSDESLSISRDIGQNFEYIGSKLSLFEHDNLHDSGASLRVQGVAGIFTITTEIELGA